MGRGMVGCGRTVEGTLLPITAMFVLDLKFALNNTAIVRAIFTCPNMNHLVFRSMLDESCPLVRTAFLVVAFDMIVTGFLTSLVCPLLSPGIKDHGNWFGVRRVLTDTRVWWC